MNDDRAFTITAELVRDATPEHLGDLIRQLVEQGVQVIVIAHAQTPLRTGRGMTLQSVSEQICPEGAAYTGVADMGHGAYKVRDGDHAKAWCCFCYKPIVELPLTYWHRTEGMEPGWVLDDEAGAA